MPLGMSFLCSSCGHTAGYVDHEVVLAPALATNSNSRPRRLTIGHRYDTRVWSELGITRDEAIAARRVRRVSHWLCTDRECGAVVEHERGVLPGALGWWAGIATMLAIALLVIASVVVPLLARGVVSVPSRPEFQVGVLIAMVLWILGVTAMVTFQEAIARWRFKSEWSPVHPARCTRCGGRELEPLILPRRMTEARRRLRAGATSAAACPRCRARAYWLVKRWMG